LLPSPRAREGTRSVSKTHGSIVATDSAVRLWLDADGIRDAPRQRIELAKASGDCIEHWQSWSGGRGASAVTLIALDGGGHTWPGGIQYLPKIVVGAVRPELDATPTIWEFFRQQPKP
jgi:polyhydroxybutyrate depolymerase